MGNALTALAAEPETGATKTPAVVVTPPSPVVLEPRRPVTEVSKIPGANGVPIVITKPIDHGPPATAEEIATLFKVRAGDFHERRNPLRERLAFWPDDR